MSGHRECGGAAERVKVARRVLREDALSLQLCDDVEELSRALAQACRDLQQAHNEVLRAQDCPEADFGAYSWPLWSPQANTIRWAERLLDTSFSKGSLA